MFYFFVESSKCYRITIAEHPGHSSPCATVNGFDNPKFSFFDPIKCHISSNSIWVISPGTCGSGKLSPNARIQRYTSVWSIFRIRPSDPKRAFFHCVKQYTKCFLSQDLLTGAVISLTKIATAFFATIALLPGHYAIFYYLFRTAFFACWHNSYPHNTL